jgi:hypothetical protein
MDADADLERRGGFLDSLAQRVDLFAIAWPPPMLGEPSGRSRRRIAPSRRRRWVINSSGVTIFACRFEITVQEKNQS